MQLIMYRSESAYGSGVRDIVDVLTYEIFELGNTDSLDYIASHYKLDKDGRELLGRLQECWENYASDSEDIQRNCIAKLVGALNRYFGVELKYCLWLADLSAVSELYSDGETAIDAYGASQYKLSDLGRDGVLFAYTEMPLPIEK